MPTATPFTALGAGNGFPFCPTRRTSSTNTSGSSMTFSLEKVMEIYWKYCNPTGTDTLVVKTLPNISGPVPQVNISSDASQSFFYGFSLSTPHVRIEPFKRVCSSNRINISSASSGITTYEPDIYDTYEQEGSTQITFDGITVYKWRELNGDGSGYFPMSFDDVPEMTGVEKYTFT
jgi:hypothetical protein